MKILIYILSLFTTITFVEAKTLRRAQPHTQTHVEPNAAPVVKIYGHLLSGDTSQGTAWFINSDLVITDYHVIENCSEYVIIYPDNEIRKVTIWYSNPICDLVALRVINPRPDQRYLSFVTNSETLKANTHVIAFGYPLNTWHRSEGQLTQGLFANSETHESAVFVSDLRTTHGGSGSPVLNDDGLVVGMVEAIAWDNEPYCAYIITTNAILEGLQITNTSHPSGYNTGVTIGLDLSKHNKSN